MAKIFKGTRSADSIRGSWIRNLPTYKAMVEYMDFTGNGGGDPDLNIEAGEDEFEDENGNILSVDTASGKRDTAI